MNSNNLEYASIFSRSIAFSIDGFLSATLANLFTFVIGFTFQINASKLMVIQVIICFFYYHYFYLTSWQATPGKRIMNIYIVKRNSPITFLAILKRNILYNLYLIIQLISLRISDPQEIVKKINIGEPIEELVLFISIIMTIIILLYFLDYITAFFNKENKTLHDHLAETLVLKGVPSTKQFF